MKSIFVTGLVTFHKLTIVFHEHSSCFHYQLATFTVDVDIFAQYIFLCISHRVLDERIFDVSENYNHNTTN